MPFSQATNTPLIRRLGALSQCAESQTRLLRLNAGLMLADRRPKTLADTRLDLHLRRLPLLLDGLAEVGGFRRDIEAGL